MQAARNTGPRQRLVAPMTLPERHETRHLLFCKIHFHTPLLGEREVANLEFDGHVGRVFHHVWLLCEIKCQAVERRPAALNKRGPRASGSTGSDRATIVSKPALRR